MADEKSHGADRRAGTSAVAVIGLGSMGSRMARRLLDAGHQVVVWNRTRAKAEHLAQLGAARATTPAEAAGRADVVLTMLADPDALRAVTEGPDGLAAGLAARAAGPPAAGPPAAGQTAASQSADGPAGPATLIEMSTVGPAAVSRLAAALPAGAGLLDAPVLGSLAEAESGTLRVFVGGPAELAERWMPLLATLGTPLHVGPLGAGAAAKLVANTTLFGVLGVLGEAAALAEGLGLSRETAFAVLSTTPLATQAERRWGVIESGEYPTRFALALARKDADLAVQAADTAGVELRLTTAARSWFADAEQAGLGERDYTAVLARIMGGTPTPP